MSAIKAAFFVKNLPAWERVLRLIAGAGGAALGLFSGGTLGMLALSSSVVFILTSLFGFCPMCALVGRRLPSKS